MRRIHYLAAAIGSLALGIGGSAAAGDLKLTSAAFTHQGSIPTRYTCEGSDISPPLSWSGIPEGTHSLALIVSDPDAPDPAAPRMTWYHWVLYAIPPEVTALPENANPQHVSAAIRDGKNSWGHPGYGGPCPPIGRHRYFFHLYALDKKLDVQGQPSAQELRQAMQGHVIADTKLMGTYEKGR